MKFSASCTYTTSKQVYLDEGDAKSGWAHIKAGKEESFKAKGLTSEKEIQDKIKEAVTSPTFIYASDRALEVYARNGEWTTKVIVNAIVGNIVTAMPISGVDGDYTLQTAALQREIQRLMKIESDGARVARALLGHLVLDFLGVAK